MTPHSFSVTLFTLGFRLFFIQLQINKQMQRFADLSKKKGLVFSTLSIHNKQPRAKIAGPPHRPRSSSEPSLNGQLHYQNDLDGPLNEAAAVGQNTPIPLRLVPLPPHGVLLTSQV
jgi:hypothetical protein